MADAHAHNKELSSAVKLIESSLVICINAIGLNHKLTALVYFNMAKIYVK